MLAPSIVFLVLYAAAFSWCAWLQLTRRARWLSRFSYIFFHTLMRLGAQICGIGVSLSDMDINWVVAYYVLQAEGYLTLIICGLRFILQFQRETTGDSWLQPLRRPDEKVYAYMTRQKRHPMFWVHYYVAAANVLIVYGSTASLGDSDYTPSDKNRNEALRIAGTAMLLAMSLVFFGFTVFAYHKARLVYLRQRIHIALIIASGVFLSLRGVYGILVIAALRLQTINFHNYDARGLKVPALAAEFCLGTTMEWLSCVFFLSTYLFPCREDGKPSEGVSLRKGHTTESEESMKQETSGSSDAHKL